MTTIHFTKTSLEIIPAKSTCRGLCRDVCRQCCKKSKVVREPGRAIQGSSPENSLRFAINMYIMLQKYTVQPQGIWARLNNFFAIDPKRSTGVPLNPQFRNPPPGANDPNTYDDPVTLPAADLAENPYWKRDVRRRYPRLSVVSQADVVGLLSVGSRADPKEGALPAGEAGAKQLVSVKEEGEKGLAAFLEKEKGVQGSILGPNGLPPMPTNLGQTTQGKHYELLEDQSYNNEWVIFFLAKEATLC